MVHLNRFYKVYLKLLWHLSHRNLLRVPWILLSSHARLPSVLRQEVAQFGFSCRWEPPAAATDVKYIRVRAQLFHTIHNYVMNTFRINATHRAKFTFDAKVIQQWNDSFVWEKPLMLCHLLQTLCYDWSHLCVLFTRANILSAKIRPVLHFSLRMKRELLTLKLMLE